MRKLPPYEKAVQAAGLLASDPHDAVVQYYRANDVSNLIRTMGKLKPVYNGRPQKWMKVMLEAAAADLSAEKSCYKGKWAGLFYKIPCIPTQSRTRYRLTVSGLRLLDYWADKHPRFKPFLDAYVSKKARNEITRDCVDFYLGIVPNRIKEIERKAELGMIKAAAISAKQEALKHQQWLAQQGMQQADYTASNQYSQMTPLIGTSTQQWASALNTLSTTVPMGMGQSGMMGILGKYAKKVGL